MNFPYLLEIFGKKFHFGVFGSQKSPICDQRKLIMLEIILIFKLLEFFN